MNRTEQMTFVVEVIFGHVVVDAWLEPTEDGFVGMGRITRYDANGKVQSDTIAPTGTKVVLE
jgi:hypothetical protein